MTDKNNPSTNLFDYATSELSQDAFIAWLCANYNSDDSQVKRASQAMLRKFIDVDDSSDISVVDVERQTYHIDILLTLEYKSEKFQVIIEDKTNSKDHDNQIERYKEQLLKDIDGNDINIRVVYYKTSILTSSELKSINEKLGIVDVLLSIHEIYEILNDELGSEEIGNAILADYVEHIRDLHNQYHRFRDRVLGEWNSNDFAGFFKYLAQEKYPERQGWYDYQDNRNGGHWVLALNVENKVEGTSLPVPVDVQQVNRNQKDSTNLLANLVVRHDWIDEKKSRKDFAQYIDIDNGLKYRSQKGHYPIMGILAEFSRNNDDSEDDASKWNYERFEREIDKALKVFDKWCNENESIDAENR